MRLYKYIALYSLEESEYYFFANLNGVIISLTNGSNSFVGGGTMMQTSITVLLIYSILMERYK